MHSFCFYFLVPDHSIILLRQPHPTLPLYANSAIMSAVGFIIDKFPLLPPPTLPPGYPHQLKVTPQHPWEDNCYHPYQFLWMDHVSNILMSKGAVRHEGTLYLEISLPNISPENPHMKNLINSQLMVVREIDQSLSSFERVQLIFKLPSIPLKQRIIGVIQYVTISRSSPFAPRVLALEEYMGQLYSNDTWILFNIADQGVPTIEELSRCHCLISTGSFQSVLDPLPHIERLIQHINEARKINKNLKYFGGCFGHQMLALEFKRKVEKRESIRCLGKIKINQKIVQSYQFLKPLEQLNEYRLIDHHSDFVLEVPPGYHLLAYSDRCPVQALISEDGLSLSIQFHVEKWSQQNTRIIKMRIYYGGNNMFSTKSLEWSKQEEEKNHTDAMIWLRAIQLFIDHE